MAILFRRKYGISYRICFENGKRKRKSTGTHMLRNELKLVVGRVRRRSSRIPGPITLPPFVPQFLPQTRTDL